MFSFESLPIDIEGFALQGSGLPKNLVHESGQPRTNFAEVLSGLKGPDGEIDVQALADNPQTLEDLGISKEQANGLFELINNGRSLPEAAQDVLFSLQNEIASVLQNMPAGGPDISLIEKLQTLEQGMQGLMQLLPEALQTVIADSLQELNGLMNWLKMVKQQILSVQQEDADLKVHTNANDQTDKSNQVSMASQAKTPGADAHIPVSAIQASAAGMSAKDTTSVAASAAEPKPVTQNMHPAPKLEVDDVQNQKTNDRKLSLQAQQSAQANANARLQNEMYGSLDETSQFKVDSRLDSRMAIDGRVLQVNNAVASQVKSVQPVSIAELTASAQTMGRMGGESTSGNMLGQSYNQSGQTFTQLMTHSSPHPVMQNLHRPEWASAVGQRLTWMIGNKMQGAQLRITPAHLGPVDIRISIENNIAQVSFVSQHQVVRDALEQAIPRLRDMLEGQNLDLADVDISDRKHAGEDQGADDFLQMAGNNSEAEGSEEGSGELSAEASRNVRILEANNLLDLYA